MKVLLLVISTGTLLVFEYTDLLSQINSSNINTRIKTDTMTYPVKNISVSINRSAEEVYQFASNPGNFPRWVAFVKSISRQGDFWVSETDMGIIRIKFAPRNDSGIIDHHVTLAGGEIVYVPMRVITNNRGCEFIFTLFWMPGRTEEEFNEDARAVTSDLQKLKEIMESK